MLAKIGILLEFHAEFEASRKSQLGKKASKYMTVQQCSKSLHQVIQSLMTVIITATLIS